MTLDWMLALAPAATMVAALMVGPRLIQKTPRPAPPPLLRRVLQWPYLGLACVIVAVNLVLALALPH